MALVDSLLSAIVRADGDALVMHVGERPYVVVGTQTINISTHGVNLKAMTSLLSELLPADSRTQLEELGAVEYPIPQPGDDRFAVVAARGGDDIWVEIRRRRAPPAVADDAKKRFTEPAAEPVAEPRTESQPKPTPPASSTVEPEPMPSDPSFAPPASDPSGAVLPLTRTVRIEVPPRTSTWAASGIDRLLRIAAARGASALVLTTDARPWIRVDDGLRQLDSEPSLSRSDVEGVILEMAPEGERESIGKGHSLEWLAEFPDVGPVHCITFSNHRGPGVMLRVIATRPATAEQLGLAREVQALATETAGLVLVTGPRAGGKSTLLSALVDLVNRQRAGLVITLEREVRLVHDHHSALVSQREIRGGADDSLSAARAALRERPDVLVVDDLVSPQMVPLLVDAASEGLLVLLAMPATSTADALQRLVELSPPDMRHAVQIATAESFRGAVAQVLLKKVGGGLVAAREVLLETAPVTRMIREGQLDQLPMALEAGRQHGMVSFTDALVDYVRHGTVDLREAFRKAPDRIHLLDRLKRSGIDTSLVERLV